MVSPLILSQKKHRNYWGSKIKILSPAKINLYLNILGNYPGGFHRIESIFERISLCDEIDIEVTRKPGIKISSNDRKLQNDNNLCCQSAKLLQENFKIPFGFNIFLNKKIPVGSGLGGGSSNAASVLMGINSILDLKLDKSLLYKLGAKLGSDVNFFISESQYAFVYGRGEKIIPFSGKEMKHFIIWPGVSLSTEAVYQQARVKLTKFFNNVKMLRYALKKGDSALIKRNIFNVLEKSACSLCVDLRKIKEYFDRKEMFLKVTGSGSCLYTIVDSFDENRSFFSGKWLVFAVQTF